MRLASLTLERYGPFERLELPLDPAPGRVNLIVAPNGFGKSVIRAAIGDLLFGIPERTPMDFRYGTERMRVLADVARDDGVLSLVRRKGRGNTLAQADGAALAPDEAQALLGGADGTVFRELFGLDTSLLRSGGQELIRSQGRLGQVLFAAGGGMGRVRELLATLEGQRDDLGKANARHKARPLWRALSEWEQAAAELRRDALRPDDWRKLEREATEAAARLTSLLDEQEAAASGRDRLRMIGAVRPWLDRLSTAQRTLGQTGDAPELAVDFEQRWRDVLETGAKSASFAEAAEAALEAAREARETLTFDTTWLDAETDIDALAEARGQALGAEKDLPRVQTDLTAARETCERLRRDLGWDVAVGLPPALVVKDAQRRLQKHPTLAANAAAAEAARSKAERLFADTCAELDALPDETDVASLADLAKRLRGDGDPASRLDAGRRKLRAAEAALARALAAIPDRPLPEAALGGTVAPSDARLEAADKALGRAEAAHAQAARDRSGRLAEIEATRTDLATLERSAMLPPPGALDGARAHRDTLWAHFCALASEKPEPAAAVAFDRAMREADAIADALIAHGREVAEAAALRGRLATLEAALAQAEGAVAKAAEALEGAQADLAGIARAAGGDAREMAALRAFLRARAEAVARRGERDTAAAELADSEAVLTRLGGLLAEAMAKPPPPVEALGALLDEADRGIEAARELAARRAMLAKLTAEHRKAFALSADAARGAAQTLADWHQAWIPVGQALARPADEALVATAEALALIEDLRAAEDDRADKERRVAGMKGVIARLAEKVASLGRLSPELAALPPIEAAASMQRRLQAEQAAEARCKDADQRIADASTARTETRTAAEDAARALAGLRAALQAEDDEAAERQLQRAREAAAARKDRAEARRALAALGGGLGVEALAARAAETTAEADADRIRAIEGRHAELATEIEAAREARTATRAALDRASTGMDAAGAAQRREAAQAMLARTAEEALVLHTAYALLQQALDRQAAGADQPLLARIGAVFHAITGGAYAGVKLDDDSKAGQTMVALEADGVTRKPLDQLSEGTSDQLYLALRIAALEDYAAVASPLPFIADDVLQTFDDPRTTATLHALLGLSAQVQVIALTHHPHVGALAATLPAGAVHVVRLES